MYMYMYIMHTVYLISHKYMNMYSVQCTCVCTCIDLVVHVSSRQLTERLKLP